MVGGAPLGAAWELGGHLCVIRAGDRRQRFVLVLAIDRKINAHLLLPVETGVEGDLHGGLVVHGDNLGLGEAHVLDGARVVVDDGHGIERGVVCSCEWARGA